MSKHDEPVRADQEEALFKAFAPLAATELETSIAPQVMDTVYTREQRTSVARTRAQRPWIIGCAAVLGVIVGWPAFDVVMSAIGNVELPVVPVTESLRAIVPADGLSQSVGFALLLAALAGGAYCLEE